MNISIINLSVLAFIAIAAVQCFGAEETPVTFEFEHIYVGFGCLEQPPESGECQDGIFTVPGISFVLSDIKPIYPSPAGCAYFGDEKKVTLPIQDGFRYWLTYLGQDDYPYQTAVGYFKFVPPAWAETVILDGHKNDASGHYVFKKQLDGGWFLTSPFSLPNANSDGSIDWAIVNSADPSFHGGVSSIQVLSGCNSCLTCTDSQANSNFTPTVNNPTAGQTQLSSSLPFGSECCDQPSSPTHIKWFPTSFNNAIDPFSIRAFSNDAETSYALANATAYRFPRFMDQPIQQVKVGESLGVVIANFNSLIWRLYNANGIGAPSLAGEYPLTKSDNSPLPLLEEITITQENATSVLYERKVGGQVLVQFRFTQDAASNSWQNENVLAGSRDKKTILTSGTGWLTTSERFEKNASGTWILVRSSSSTTATINGIEVVIQETEGGETVSSHGYYPTGRKKWTVNGDGSWRFFTHDTTGYQIYSPYGDTEFPGNDWIPALSVMTGIRCDSYTETGVTSQIESIVIRSSSSNTTSVGNYESTVTTSGTEPTTRTTSITESDFVFQGFRGRVLLEDDGRGLTTLHEYKRGTVTANGFTPSADGDAVMEIITKGESTGAIPVLQLYDSDELILHPATVGAKFSAANTAEARIDDSKRRTVYTATLVLDGASHAVATHTLRSYTSMPNNIGEIITDSRDGRVISISSSTSDGTWEETVDEAGFVRTTQRDLLDRVTTETSPGPEGATITRSHTYNGLTSTVTTTGGGLSLTTSETRDLRGTIISSTDEAGIVTGFTHTNGGRTTTVSRPGGVTEVTSLYLDGRFKERSGSGVIREFASYAVDSAGNEITKRSTGPALTDSHGARWTETTTNPQGRTLSVRRPGPPNETGGRQVDIIENHTHDSVTGKTTSIVSSARPGIYQLIEENLLGTWVASGTATHTGPLVANSSDRFSITVIAYQKRNGYFWQVTTRSTSIHGATPVVTSSAVRLWAGDGEASESTDAANITTTRTTTHDSANKTTLITTNHPLQGTTVETTTGGFLMKRSIPGAAQDETFGYDRLGREIRRTDVRNASTHTRYNNLGQINEVIVHLGQSVSYTHYPANHSSAGRIHTQTDTAGKITEFIYDLLGRVLSIGGNAAYPESRTYDNFGDRETLTTYGTQTAITTWVNDPPTGLLLEKKYHGQSSGIKYTYFGDGSMASRTWRRGLRTDYGYNMFRDLTSITYPDTTPDVSFSNFDRLGRPRTVTEGSDVTTLVYDPLTGEPSTTYAAGHSLLPGLSVAMKTPNSGRPGGYTLQQGSTTLEDVLYDYDSLSRFGGLTSANHQVGYQYYPGTNILRETTHTVAGSGTPRIETRSVDLANRTTGVLTTVPSGNGRRTAASAGYHLNARGLREKLTREDGTSWNYGYNDRREVTSGLKKLANGNLAAGLQFGYLFDGIGNRQSAKSGGDSSGNNQRTVNYTPNALNQYSEITTPDSFDVLVRSPNAVGISVNGTAATIATQGTFHRAEATATNTGGAWAAIEVTSHIGQNSVSGHRWLPPATFHPTHDDDGNLLDDGRWINTWDAENRLITQTTSTQAAAAGVPRIKIENTHDWQSRRIGKKVSSSNNGINWTPISDERFIYNRWNPLAIFNASSSTLTLKQTNLWGIDLSGTLQGAGGVGGLLSVSAISEPSTPIYYPSFDGNGNIIAWTSTNGDTLQRIDYDPFGNVVSRESVPEFVAPAWGFSTKYQDKETGLLYYGFRFYDPVTGRWLSKDPIGERGGINLYGFVGNDGVNYIDLLGLADINVEIVRQYLKWETVGTFTASPSDDNIKKCCGSVSGQTLELKKGNYEVADGRGNKNYPIYEGERNGVYSPSSNTSINGQQRWLDNNYPNSNGAPRALVPGTIGENNINVISNNPTGSGQSSFGGTRMHHGNNSQSSEGCPIVGCNMKKGDIINSRYSDYEEGKKFPGHYFDKEDSIAKAIELNTLVECAKKHLKRNPSIKVNIRSN